ncbi:hypothetical protein MMA231_04109 (plasmid) [Asticcacaulis sp. MM231]
MTKALCGYQAYIYDTLVSVCVLGGGLGVVMISSQVLKQKSFFVGDVIDKSTKLTPRYHARQQVAEIIATHLIQKGRVWVIQKGRVWAREDVDGPLLSSQPCCIVGGLVSGGQGWTGLRRKTTRWRTRCNHLR